MRKKIDGLVLSNTTRHKNKKSMSPKNQRELKSSEPEDKYDLRRSMVWDNAFFASQGFLEPEELFPCLCLSDKQNSCTILCLEENKLVPTEFLEAEAKKETNENIARTSLAWDNAFFTNEGVLDHEELAMVNKGFQRSDPRRLQKIEELRNSSESNSTNDSEVSSFASFEIEISEDAEASTHKMRETSKLGRENDKQTKQSTKSVAGSLQLKFQKRLPYNGRQKLNKKGSERNKMDVSLTPPRQVNRIPKAPINANYSHTIKVKGENKMANTTTGDNSSVSVRSDLENSGSASPLSSENVKYEYSVFHTSGTSADDSDKSTPSRSKFDSSLTRPVASSSGFINYETKSECYPPPPLFPSVTKPPQVTVSSSSFISACYLEPASSFINQSPYRPSGLRMPSPKIGFFDQENKLAPLHTDEEMKSNAAQNHSSEKLLRQETLSSNNGIERIPRRKSRQCTITGAGKGLGHEKKILCLRKESF